MAFAALPVAPRSFTENALNLANLYELSKTIQNRAKLAAQAKAKAEAVPGVPLPAVAAPLPGDSGQGMGNPSRGEPGVTGKMDPEVSSFFGGLSGMNLGMLAGEKPTTAQMASALLGSTVTSAVPALQAPFGLMSLASALAPAQQSNPRAGFLSEPELADIAARYGNEVARDARDAQAARENSIREAAVNPEMAMEGWFGARDPESPVDPGLTDTASGTGRDAGPSPGAGSMGNTGQGNTDSASGQGGDAAGGGQTDSGRGSSDVGSDASGQGGAWKRGGVTKATRGAKHAIFGEKGPEEAIFIPKGGRYDMRKPGIQGNELAVRRALQMNLAQLYRAHRGRR